MKNPLARSVSGPRLAFLAALIAALGMTLSPKPALALPTFAQAYKVDCSLCHSFVPALNAYGRYVQSTAFGALDPKVMHRALPVVIRETIAYKSIQGGDKLNPALKATTLSLSANVVGVLNKYFSYRFEQSLYSSNVGGGSTGHFWVSYNHLFNGDGHLVVGKFDPPSAPAYSYWMDVTGLKAASITVGQHGYALGGQRWGIGFNYVPQDYKHVPYKAQIGYFGNSNSMFNASTFSTTNPYLTGGAQSASGSDKDFQYRVAWARPDNPVEVGVTGASGTYILNQGYINPIDKYNAWGVYAERDPNQKTHFPGLLFNYQQTYDSNIGPGKAAQNLTQAANSWSYAFEVDQPFWKYDMLGIRPVEYLGGYNACANNGVGSIETPVATSTITKSCAVQNTLGYYDSGYTRPHYGAFDLLLRDPKFSRYLWFMVEDTPAASGYNKTYNPYNKPVWVIDVRWASGITGPMFGPNW